MFNSKLKQQIAALEASNQQLQAQYDTVFGLLQQRQDEVLDLQRTLSTLRQQPQSKLSTNFYSGLEERVEEIVNHRTNNILTSYIPEEIASDLIEYLKCKLDSDSDEDEDEDDYDHMNQR